MELFESGDYAKLYYFLQIPKMQMQSYLKLTKEEIDLFQKAINSRVSHIEEKIDSKPVLTEKKTMAERLGLD